MKRFFQALLCLLTVLFLCSCAPETDFVISRETMEQTESEYEENRGILVVINKNSFKYHLDLDCTYVSRMSAANRLDITVPDEAYLEEHGYSACKRCAGEK